MELSPFARATDDDPKLTERFEYFAGGMELGNAFSEINDAVTQQERFEMQSSQVEGERGDPDYVEALSYGMPPTGGLGFGIDRFTMLLTGRETIRDVILFPALRVWVARGRAPRMRFGPARPIGAGSAGGHERRLRLAPAPSIGEHPPRQRSRRRQDIGWR